VRQSCFYRARNRFETAIPTPTETNAAPMAVASQTHHSALPLITARSG